MKVYHDKLFIAATLFVHPASGFFNMMEIQLKIFFH